MQITKYFLAISLYLFLTNAMSSQEILTPPHKEWTIGAGISLVNVKDSRMSAIKYRSWQPTYHLGYKSQSEKTIQEFRLDFTMNQKRNTTRFLDLSFIMPAYSYSLEKKVRDIWLGGFFNSTTLLTMPKTRTGHFNNNPISYTISNTIGPKVSYRKMFDSGRNNNRFEMNTSLETSLLGYVIRPAFGHPYPERYLESGTFSPTKSGMAGPLLRSGKIMSVDKFQSFKVVIGLSYHIGENCKIGLRVNMQYQNISNDQPSSMMAKDLLFTASYVY